MLKPISAKIAMIISIISCFSAVGIRTYQLINITDVSTGFLIISNHPTVYAFYGVLLVGVLAVLSLNYTIRLPKCTFQKKPNKSISGFSYFLSAMFFADFVHQAVNSFEMIEESNSIAMNQIIPVALVGFSALISCFYFMTFGISYSSKSYDFKSFGYLNIVPAFWATFRMLDILIKAINFRADIQSLNKSAYLVLVIAFFCVFALAIIDNNSNNAKKITIFGYLLAIFGIILTVPRYLLVLFNKVDLITVDYSTTVTDFALSLFVFVFAHNISNDCKEEG